MTVANSRHLCLHITGILLLILTIIMLIAGFVLVCLFERPDVGYWAGGAALLAGALCSVAVTCYACVAFRRKASLFGCINASQSITNGSGPYTLEEEESDDQSSNKEPTEKVKQVDERRPSEQLSQGYASTQKRQQNEHPNNDSMNDVDIPNDRTHNSTEGHNAELQL